MSKITTKKDIGTVPGEKNTPSPLFNLGPISGKPLEISFSAEKVSTDGGLLLLKEVENHIGIIDAVASFIKDSRHQSYVGHSVKELVAQRVFQIAAGYEDANDCNALKGDS